MVTTTIDPATLTPDNPEAPEIARKLFAFFEEQSQQGIKAWPKGKAFRLDSKTHLRFKQNVLQRKRKEGKTGFRYEFVSDRELGSVSESMLLEMKKQGLESKCKVLEIDGTLALTADHFKYKPKGSLDKHGEPKTQVVKVQEAQENSPVVLNEHRIAEFVKYFGVKKPVFYNGYSYLVEREFTGVEFLNVLDADLTLYQRIEITRQLLLAIKYFTELGIIHRDVKCTNALVDLRYPIKVTLIDTGLSSFASEPSLIGGTQYFTPPEMFNGTQHTPKIDVFCAARTLLLLWGIDDNSWAEDFGNGLYATDLSTLFNNITGLTDEQKKQIRSTLEGMLHINSEKRFSIDEALAGFNLLGDFTYERALYKLEKMDDKLGRSLTQILARLEKGAQSKNPYWMNASKKFDKIVAAVLSTTDIKAAMQDKHSTLYQAVNMQRIPPLSFFGSQGKTRSLKAAKEDKSRSCMGLL
ncbi:MAG: protein kinase [Tatlockia sp.]